MEVVQERQERGCLSLAAAAYIEPGHQVCPTPRLDFRVDFRFFSWLRAEAPQ